MSSAEASIIETVNSLDEYNLTHKLEFYEPYGFQKKFHHAHGCGEYVFIPSDRDKEGLAIFRALQCANQVGKTYCGGMEAAMHLTGRYPDWWKGHRFSHPITMICSSTTNETTRDRCQGEMLGEPTEPDLLGTGTIPKECIGKLTRKAGVPDAYEVAMVKHMAGWSKCYFKCYEQGPKKFMGYRLHAAWCDEEPPGDIWSQITRGMLATNGMAYITYTPEEGITEVVHAFMEDERIGHALTSASWEDAPHMTPGMMEQKLASIPPHEREMRSKGVPVMGSGLIFPIPDEDIWCDPIQIPNYWARIIGIDFGWDHPFAAIALAHDREADVFYLYDSFAESKLLIPVAIDRLHHMSQDWIPIVWPHDGLIHDKQSGKPLAEMFREKGLPFHPDQFSNPPGPGQKEGQGGQGVEVGLQALYTAMIEGRFKVFKNQEQWFKEKRTYHRKDGKVVKLRDDLMSASRYAFQMSRHAIHKLPTQKRTIIRKGLSNW